VSGFNVEFGGFKFALIFLAEYASIIWISFLLCFCFIGRSLMIIFVIVLIFSILLFLFFRSAFPRVRYDILMFIVWKKLLPFVLFLYLFTLIVL
jgi:NADH-ubiquinone oxidoreductase chain 1